MERRSILVGEPHPEKEVAVNIHLPILPSHGPRVGPCQGLGMALPQDDRHQWQVRWHHLNRMNQPQCQWNGRWSTGWASPSRNDSTTWFFYLRDEDFWRNDFCLLYISLHIVFNKYLLKERENKYMLVWSWKQSICVLWN